MVEKSKLGDKWKIPDEYTMLIQAPKLAKVIVKVEVYYNNSRILNLDRKAFDIVDWVEIRNYTLKLDEN